MPSSSLSVKKGAAAFGSSPIAATRVYKPGSVLTAIYLDLPLPAGSSHLLGTTGPVECPTHGVAPNRVYSTPMFPWGGCALTAPFHPYPQRGGISLLHLSWGHPRRALPVILALWSPDFPHRQPFGLPARLSNPVAPSLYQAPGKMSMPQHPARSGENCPGRKEMADYSA